MYYLIISPRQEDYDWLEILLMKKLSPNLRLVVKELGKSGNHPHLNIIYDSQINRTQEVNRKIKNIIKKEKPDYEITKNLLVVKNIYDLNPLIGNYLQKEDSYQILYTHPSIDLKVIKEQLVKNNNYRAKRYQWAYVPTFLEFPLFYLDYCHNNMLEEDSFRDVLLHMARNKIAVHPILKRKDDILWQISAMKGHDASRISNENPQINFSTYNISNGIPLQTEEEVLEI